MNKLFLVILAVCLVSTHAFVRRDAPTEPNQNPLDNLPKDFGKFINESFDKIKEAFDPEKIKATVNKIVDDVKTKTSEFTNNQQKTN